MRTHIKKKRCHYKQPKKKKEKLNVNNKFEKTAQDGYHGGTTLWVLV